jgi:hypothetical protein
MLPAEWQHLVPPNANYDYFAALPPHWEQCIAQPQVHNAKLASWLCDVSLLSYFDEANARNRVPMGWFLNSFGNAATTGYGMLMHRPATSYSPSLAIIAMRGMPVGRWDKFLEVLKPEAAAPKTPWGNSNARVHGELYRRLFEHAEQQPSLFGAMMALLNRWQPQQIWFTGHGLGGAYALLAAANFGRSTAVHTFGAPAVGNVLFGQASGLSEKLWRTVHGQDVLPLALQRGLSRNGYAQFGYVRHIGPPAAIREALMGIKLPALSAITADANITRRLVDHAPVRYAKTLQQEASQG